MLSLTRHIARVEHNGSEGKMAGAETYRADRHQTGERAVAAPCLSSLSCSDGKRKRFV